MPGHAPRKPRYMVSRKVRVQSGSATADGMVVDLHEWGARLEAPVPFAVGETVSFTLSQTEVTARVMWCRDRAAGLSFAVPIPADLVAELHRATEGWITL